MVAPPFTLPNAPTPLTTPTYDNSGQVIHPDILRFDKTGILPAGKNFIMAITPYPYANNRYENPSIMYSVDGQVWVQTPAVNPIEPAPPAPAHNADPNIAFFNDYFWLYWLYRYPNGDVYMKLRKSANSYEYGSLVPFESGNPHVELFYDPIDRKFKSVGFGSTIYYTESLDGVNWTVSELYAFPLPSGVSETWHCSIERLSNGMYWMLFEEPTHRVRWFANSRDCKHWTGYYDTPVMGLSSGWDNWWQYKSSFIVENGKIMCWYSGINTSYVCRIGYSEALCGTPIDVYSITSVIGKGLPPPPPPPTVTEVFATKVFGRRQFYPVY